MNENVPLVSVVLATKDRKQVLIDCLKKYETQTYPRIEFIVADNGSSDGTAQALRQELPFVTVIECGANIGPTAINMAVELAAGKYLFRVDDDSYPSEPHTIENAVKFLESNPTVTVLTGNVRDRIHGYELLNYYPFRIPEQIPHDGLPFNEFCGAGALIRREDFKMAGGFWEEFYYEELDLSSKILLNGGIIRFSPLLCVHHESAFSNTNNHLQRWLLVAKQKMRYQFKYFGRYQATYRAFIVALSIFIYGIARGFTFSNFRQVIEAMKVGAEIGLNESVRTSIKERRIITMRRNVLAYEFRHNRVMMVNKLSRLWKSFS